MLIAKSEGHYHFLKGIDPYFLRRYCRSRLGDRPCDTGTGAALAAGV